MNQLLSIVIVGLLYFSIAWLHARAKNRIGIIDAYWGPGFVIIAVTAISLGGRASLPTFLMLLATSLWAFRLWSHLRSRSVEDRRYAAMRETWRGSVWANAYFRIFLVQTFILLAVAAPLIVAGIAPPAFSVWTLVGLVVWVCGFWFEVTADSQLQAWIRTTKAKGKLMTNGVWSRTRHPNYFGEVLMWFGLGIVALPSSWWALLGGFVITSVFVFVSIPLTEKTYRGRPDYERYKKRAWSLVPKLW